MTMICRRSCSSKSYCKKWWKYWIYAKRKNQITFNQPETISSEMTESRGDISAEHLSVGSGGSPSHYNMRLRCTNVDEASNRSLSQHHSTTAEHSTEQLISFIRTGNMSSSSSCSHTCMYMVYEELFLMSTTYILSLSWQLFFNVINYCISLYISGGFHSSRLADRWTFIFLSFHLLRNGNLTRIWTLLTRDVIEKLCDLRYLFQF